MTCNAGGDNRLPRYRIRGKALCACRHIQLVSTGLGDRLGSLYPRASRIRLQLYGNDALQMQFISMQVVQ